MLSLSLGAAAMSAVSGVAVTKTGIYRPVIWLAFAVYAVGLGLMSMLDSHSSSAVKVIYPLIAAFGLGALFQTPLIALQAAMPIKDMATSTGTFGFIRTLGGTVGISIGQTIFSSFLRKDITKVPNVNFDTSAAGLAQSVRNLKNIADPTTRAAVIQVYSQSISKIWLVMAPIVAASFIMSLAIRNYSLQRKIIDGNEKTRPSTADVEKGTLGDATLNSQEGGENAEKDASRTASAGDIENGPTVEGKA